MLRNVIDRLRERSREKRGYVFRKYLKPCKTDKILDLGSEDGSHIASLIAHRENVTIADISRSFLETGQRTYGFKTLLLPENGHLPTEDKTFDIVYCSSVIEHVTVEKDKVYEHKTGRAFHEEAFKRQKQFADEIRRIGKNYFVQTPNKHFFVESHSWLPLVNWLPRRLLVRLLQLTNRFWIKKTIPDWNLLSARQMKELFPNAEIVRERFLFMTKSLMAIKSDRKGNA